MIGDVAVLTVMSGKDLEYKAYTLGDIGVIELLLLYRYKYDDNFFLDDSIPMAVSGAARLNEEVLVTYADLDQYIKWCKFSSQQMKMISLISEGYSYEEIAEEMNIIFSTVSGRLKTIYKRIAKENDWQWKKSIYLDKLSLRSKTCSRCAEELPGTVEFYSDNKDSKDGFHSICKVCRK